MSLAALSFATTACEDKKEDLGAPSVELGQSEVTFEQSGGETTVQLTATRDWKATTDQDWISIDPREGKASSKAVTIEIKVNENKGINREGSVKFDIGFDSKTLTIKQKGSGSAEDLIVYKNDFDKEKAAKGDSGWKTYLDSFDGWRNETGTGIASVTYASSGISARTNNYHSGSSASDYSGSGMNYLWFGKAPYFMVKNIALPASKNYTLSFGAERNEYSESGTIDNTFKHDEFKVYVSNDGKKWVELEYSFPAGDKNKRWDLASSTFTVPDGTSALYLYFKSTKASVYCFDDLTLSVSDKSGTEVDFSKGIEITDGGSDTPGSDYSKAESKTVKDFIATASTSTYYKLKGKVSRFNSQYCSFDLTDETGTIYVYKVDDESKSSYSDKIKDGGTVELAGLYLQYNGKDEVVNAHILSYSDGSSDPAKEMTISQVLNAPAGTAAIVSGTVAATYQRGFIITDGTDYLLVYDGSKCAAKEKDNVKVTGTTSEYGGLIQLASPEVTVVSSGNALTLPSPKALDAAAFDAYSSSKIEYISYEGTLSVSGNYVNVEVAGASKHTGSLAYINDSFNAKSFDGAVVKVTGFYVGLASNNKYVNTMVTELVPGGSDYLTVSTTALSAATDATTATFDVKANVAWTVTSDNSAYTVEPASGNGNATVTVKFAANTEETSKVVNLTVSTTAEVATKSYTVTLTHRGKGGSQGGTEVVASVEKDYLAKNKSGKVDDVISYENDSEYTGSVSELRVYKGQNLTIKAADGYTITKVEFTCTKDCGVKYGFYTTSPVTVDSGATTTSEGNGNVGTITVSGNTTMVKYTAKDNQMRVTKLTVTYKAVK